MRPIETCELCGRSARLTKHHLIPRARHSRHKKKKDWKVGINLNHTAMFCRECHGKVHATFSEKELDLTYNSVTKLREHPEIETFLKWVRKQNPNSRFRTKQTK